MKQIGYVISYSLVCLLALGLSHPPWDQDQQRQAPSNIATSTAQDAQSLREQAQILWHQGEQEQSLELLNSAVERFPQDADNYFLRGHRQGDLRHLADAIADLHRVTELAPDFAGGWGSLGWYQLLDGKWTAARHSTERAVQRDPNYFNWQLNLGHTYWLMGDDETARRHYRKALPQVSDQDALAHGPLADFSLFAEKGWRPDDAPREQAWFRLAFKEHTAVREAAADLATAQAETQARNFPQAIAAANRAWRAYHRLLDESHPQTIRTRKVLAGIHLRHGRALQSEREYDAAIAAYEQYRQHSPENAGHALRHIGDCRRAQHLFGEAIKVYEQAMQLIAQSLGEESSSYAIALSNQAEMYDALGQYPEARSRYQRAIVIGEKTFHPANPTMGVLFSNLAGVYWKLSQYAEAEAGYEKALKLMEPIMGRDSSFMATVLNNLAVVNRSLEQYAKAEEHFRQALSIKEKILGPHHLDVAILLNNLAETQHALGQQDEAKAHYERALAIAQGAEAAEMLWIVHGNLSHLAAERQQYALAVFFAKQAVNQLQSIRHANTGLNKELLQSFLQTKEAYYKHLADLLIAEGRLPEAQQVLDMLKEAEYLEFTRHDLTGDGLTQAELNALEATAVEWLRAAAEDLKSTGALVDVLHGTRPELADIDQQAQWDALTQKYAELETEFKNTLEKIALEFSALDKAQSRQLQTKLQLNTDHRERISELGSDVALVQYLVLEDQVRILINTPEQTDSLAIPLTHDKPNRLAQAYYDRIKAPGHEFLPLARALHHFLIQPILPVLEKTGATTLMFYQDGVLRYLPFATFHDGDRYLLERFALARYTAAARQPMSAQRVDHWRVAGLGVSQAHAGFTALPAVSDELNAIVYEEDGDPEGVLPGVVHLDQDFTRERLADSLREGYPILHLASHFVFRPGNEERSFLLLGDGQRLSLGSLRKAEQFDFSTIDLLTLSACETALDSADTSGKEIEGLGTLAQKKGASSVMATLWPVADESTSLFMRTFYHLRTAQGLTKAETLRQAQLALLKGDAETSDPLYAHPYYWAPFILMGNWL